MAQSINNLTAQPLKRYPRFYLKINNNVVKKGLLSIQIEESSFYCADTFTITLAIDGLQSILNDQYFSDIGAILIEIYIGFLEEENQELSNLPRVMVGQVDDVVLNESTRVLTLSGRDLTARFIDNTTTKKFLNLTASEAAIQLAKKEGLNPVVTPTKAKIGTYYTDNYVAVSTNRTEWDLLSTWAQIAGYSVFVRDYSLYFQPLPTPTQTPYLITFQKNNNKNMATNSNVTQLQTKHSLTIAKDVFVEVRSFNPATGKAIKATARSSPLKRNVLAGVPRGVGNAQIYIFVKGGLNKEQAIQFAQQKLKDITKNERVITFTLPADDLLHKDSVIKVTGLNTSFDQIYYPSSINRTLSMGGYHMTVTAKNHSTISETLL